MRFNYSLFLGLCATVMLGCSEHKTVQETSITSAAQTSKEISADSVFEPKISPPDTVTGSPEPLKPSFTVDVINGYLDEFRGCACYFARNQKELEQEKFIYFNDYQQKALVSVNGTRIPLVGMAKGDTAALNSPYKDPKGRYEVHLTIQQSQQTGDEVAFKRGTMQVKDVKTGSTQNIPFVGECGC